VHDLLAAIPLVTALALMRARVPMSYAALASLASAVIVAVPGFPTPAGRIAAGEWHAMPTCVEVALILLGGVVLSELMSSSGANARLAEWIAAACRGRERGVVLVVLGVTPFAESVTGFGVGAVVAVPLLRRLGLPPLRAAVTGLLGLVIVPWGALGPGTLVASQLTGVSLRRLGELSALLSLPVYLLLGVAGLVSAVGARRAMAALPELITAVITLGACVWAVNAFVAVPLAGALGGAASVVAVLVMIALREGRAPRVDGECLRSVGPYLLLMALLLAAHGVVAMAPGNGEAWAGVVTSPAPWILITCAVTPGVLRMSGSDAARSARVGARRWLPVAVTTVAFLVLGELLTVTGMSAALAASAVRLGTGYLLLAPFVGALGGFLAGSNTGANAMLAASQAVAARSLSVSVAGLVAVQNVSASLATMASASRVALASSVAADRVPPLVPAAAGTAGAVGTPPAEAAQEPRADRDMVDPARVMREVAMADLVVLAVLAAISFVVF
jgi:lactate permease